MLYKDEDISEYELYETLANWLKKLQTTHKSRGKNLHIIYKSRGKNLHIIYKSREKNLHNYNKTCII